MDPSSVLVIGLWACFLVFLLSGLPVGIALIGSAMIFSVAGYFSDIYFNTWTGIDFNFFGLVVSRVYGTMSNWIFCAIPMFIYMGMMLDRSGTAERLMRSSQRLFGNLRGGLTVTATIVGVLMAASTGIIGASVVLLGSMALPTMLKQGYSKSLSTGTICAAGCLGILIPPSIMLVIFATQLGVPVGDLFLGAVFPGLILAGLYLALILIWAFLKPEDAPLPADRESISMSAVLEVVKDVIPPIILIVAVLGSIFAGIATVTEASGVGALATTIIALLNKNLSWEKYKDVLRATFRTVGYLAFIMVGASTFAVVLRGLGGDELIEGALTSLPFEPSGVVLMIVVAVFFLGFFVDWIEISFIILPVIGPVIEKLNIGIDGQGVIDNPALVWFSVLIAVTLQTSFLTPPVGPGIFYLQGICPPNVKISDIFKGVIPFVILQLLTVGLLFLWPEIITWLPIAMYR